MPLIYAKDAALDKAAVRMRPAFIKALEALNLTPEQVWDNENAITDAISKAAKPSHENESKVTIENAAMREGLSAAGIKLPESCDKAAVEAAIKRRISIGASEQLAETGVAMPVEMNPEIDPTQPARKSSDKTGLARIKGSLSQ